MVVSPSTNTKDVSGSKKKKKNMLPPNETDELLGFLWTSLQSMKVFSF